MRARKRRWVFLLRISVCACAHVYMARGACARARVCVTGVQRGPARGTEFKFQIWSVSQGVTVCIALPASSNSLHRWCVFVLFPPFPSFIPAAHSAQRFPLFPASPGAYIHKRAVAFIPSIYLSISIFHIIQTREESNLIDRQKRFSLFRNVQELKNVIASILPLISIFFL